MLSFDEQVAPELSSLEPFLPTGPRPSSSVPRKPDPLTVQRLAPPSHVASGLLTTEDAEAFAAAAAADLVRFLGPTDKTSAFVLPEQMQSMTDVRTAVTQHGAASADGGPAAAECEALLRRAWGGPVGATCRGEGGRESGGDEAGAAARSPREGTRNDVSDDIERRRRDCAFDHVLCHSVHMKGDMGDGR